MRAKIIMINRWFFLLLTLIVLVSSCSSSDETNTDNDYCYIKSVALGTVKRKIEQFDREGNHIGTVNAFFAGNAYAMTVNQRTGLIENTDSLPFGSQLSAVLATITFDGAVLSYLNANGEWIAYNAQDSLDLSGQLQLLLTSNDRTSTRKYSIKVNVHKQEGDSLFWKQCESDVTLLADMADMKAFVLNGKLMVLGKQSIAGVDKMVLAERSGVEVQGTWEEKALAGLLPTADLQTLKQQGNKLYLSTSDGKILSSTDAENWTQEGADYSSALVLVEKTDKYFYAISDGKLRRSADANAWDEDKPNTETAFPDAEYLPDAGIRAITVVQANGSRRIVMIGQRAGSANTIVWNKTWNEGWKISEEDSEWMFFLASPDNDKLCPRLNYLNLQPYDGKCVVFGGTSADGSGSHKALDAIYVSQDYGVTWHQSPDLHLPVQLEGTNDCITSVVDKDNYIWIITNTQVWRGRLNRLGFAQQ